MEAGAFLSPGQLDPGAAEGAGGGGPVALRRRRDGRLPVLPDLQTCLQDTPGPRHSPPLQDRAIKGHNSLSQYLLF